MKITDIIIGKRHRKQLGDIKRLSESMAKLGQIHPVVVTPKNELVAGWRRIKAAESLGWEEVEVKIAYFESMLQAEHDENECREEFTASERVAICDAIRDSIRGGQLATPPGEKSREAAAEAAGFASSQEYRRAKEVVQNGVPELVEAMDSGEVSASAAATVSGLPDDEQKATVKAGTVAYTAAAMKRRGVLLKLIASVQPGLAKKLEADDEITNADLEKAKPLCCDKCDRLGPQLRCSTCLDIRMAAKAKKKPLQEGEIEEPQNRKPNKRSDSLPPIVREHPFDELKSLTIRLSGLFTKAMKNGTEEGGRLHDYLALCACVDHPPGKEPCFIPLRGICKIIELAGRTGKVLSDAKIREEWQRASGAVPYIPPAHARRRAFKAGTKKTRSK